MTIDTPAEAPLHPPTFAGSFFRGIKKLWLTYVTFVVLVMAVAGLIVSISSISQTNRQNQQLKALVDCQNRYNEINNERTRQLAEATSKERTAEAAADSALFRLIAAVAQQNREAVSKGVAELRTRLEEQEKARAAGDKERIDHPVPPPPKALCGFHE